MGTSKKQSNGSQDSRESTPVVTSRRVVSEADPAPLLDAAQPVAKKLFPLFAPRAKKPEATSSERLSQSDVEDCNGASGSTTIPPEGSQSSQGTSKKGKASQKSKANGKAKGAVNGSSKISSDASSRASNGNGKAKKSKSGAENRKDDSQKLTKTKSASPVIADVDLTISAVASTSNTSLASTPPREPDKEVIHITDSPVREIKLGKTFEDFAAERKLRNAAKEAGGWTGGHLPLWPSRHTLHVLSSDTPSTYKHALQRDLQSRRDWKGKGRAIEVSDDVPNWTTEQMASARRIATCFPQTRHQKTQDETQGVDPTKHPLLARLKEDDEGDSRLHDRQQDRQQMWASRYAPHKAREVLEAGNRSNAALLKDWLQELMLQDPSTIAENPKKRKIKRAVTSDERKKARKAAKRRKRKGFDDSSIDNDDLDDFIASDSEEEHYAYYDFSDSASLPSPTKSTASQAETGSIKFTVLTNAILLAGPVASGKTSTAYAVANELDFQVFEVYPGIGKRGYKDLERYVGMVGGNHIMKRDGPVTASSTGLASFFGKTSQAKKPVEVTSDSSSPIPHALPRNGEMASSASIDHKVKQSLILIEEIDVLFNSDSGFWEGLVALIAKSRRPVILTCNDHNALPPDLLPLQCILHFILPPASIAGAFLQGVSSINACTLTPKEVTHLGSCLGHDSDAGVDLRRALSELQSHIKTVETHEEAGDISLSPLNVQSIPFEAALFFIENLSMADAEVRRRSFMQIEDDESVALPSKEDDEMLDYHTLPIHKLGCFPPAPPSRPLPCYGREAEMCSYLGLPAKTAYTQLLAAQSTLCEALSELADELFDESHVRTGDSIFHQDVLPMLREIVKADDMQDEAFKVALELSADELLLDARVRRSRRIAGSAKEGYKRHLDASKEVTQTIRDSGYGLDILQDLDENVQHCSVVETIAEVSALGSISHTADASGDRLSSQA